MTRADAPIDVVVTGMGCVGNAGIGADALWTQLVAPVDRPIDTSPLVFDPSPWFGPNEARRLDPYLWYAVAASEEAWFHAGMPDLDPARAGVVMGNLYGATSAYEHQRSILQERGPSAVSPWLCAVACEDACASQLSIRRGFTGPSKLVVASCASGTVAIADGAAMIASGTADLVLCGATLGPVPTVLRTSYDNLRVTSPSHWVRPFDLRRDGFAFAEGAAVVVLERGDRAKARGAPVLGHLLGWGQTNDAFHMSKPSGFGLEQSMRLALHHAAIPPSEVRAVNAHGTGTLTGDAEEVAAIGRIFDDHRPAITSVKGRTGHALAASGAFEVLSVLLSFDHRLIPATAVDAEPDPTLAGDVVWGAPRPWVPGVTLTNSFGLGGHNATLVLAPP